MDFFQKLKGEMIKRNQAVMKSNDNPVLESLK